MTFIIIKTIHLMAAFVYGGFLITDNLFNMRMQKHLTPEEYAKARGGIATYIRKIVPPALVIIMITGLYMISQVFGTIGEEGMTRYQMLLSLKAFLGIWLGLRGSLQVYAGIQPLVFKGHRLPFVFVLTIIFLSQFMHI
jgi:hypothetical protein